VEVLVEALLKNGSLYMAAYSDSFVVQKSMNQPAECRRFISYFNRFDANEIRKLNLMPVHTVLFHRGLYDSLGGLKEDLHPFEDQELWRRYSSMTDFLAVEKTTSKFIILKDKIY
jgi:hypothetical protein